MRRAGYGMGLQEAAAAKFDDILKPKETRLEKELKEITRI
jgi:hypothetical protein